MILHVTTSENWEKALSKGYYEHESLAKENFIHACSESQLAGVLQRYYSGVSNLVLLHIDPAKLESPLKYEHSPSTGDSFPHIYGPINISAVTSTENI